MLNSSHHVITGIITTYRNENRGLCSIEVDSEGMSKVDGGAEVGWPGGWHRCIRLAQHPVNVKHFLQIST